MAAISPNRVRYILIVGCLLQACTGQTLTRHGTAAYLDVCASKAYVNARFRLQAAPRQQDTELNMGGRAIQNMSDPTSPQDAATKQYVDTHAAGGAALLPVDGSRRMAGNLNMGGNSITNLSDPEIPEDVATKNYVDSRGLRTYSFTNKTNGIATDIHIDQTYTLFAGDLAILGVWVAIYDPIRKYTAWKNAYTLNSDIPLTLEFGQPAARITFSVGPNIPNATGDVVLQILVYPGGTLVH